MELNCTETFEMTWDDYFKILDDDEYKEVLEKHKKDKLPGLPSKFKYRLVVSMGGSRSSKTYSILQLLMLEMINRKRIKITVWRNFKNICRSTVMEDFEEIIMFNKQIYKDFKHNKQSGTFTYLPTMSKIIFEGADTVGKVIGGKQHISYFNEITEFNEDVYLQITQRTSDRIICDYNPSKDFFIENYRNNERAIFIHSNFRNNGYCPAEIVTQLNGYEPWESGSYEIVGSECFYKGEKISKINQPPHHEKNIKNGTANEYLWMVYGLGIGAEKPLKIYHGWHKVTDEEFDNINSTSYFGLDFGAKHPTAIVEVKYSGDGAFYIRERLYQALNDIEDSLSTIIQIRVPQIKIGNSLIVADSAKSSWIEMLAYVGHYIIGAKKGQGSVSVGITLMQKFQIFYVPTDNLQREYDNYEWDTDINGKPKDEPLKKDDDLMDATRYIISFLVEYLSIKI